MAEVKKVVFATEEVTVHLLMSPGNTVPEKDHLGNEMWATESKVLLPGQSVEQSAVPPYLLDAVKAGTAPGLQLMTEKKANEVAEHAALIRGKSNSSVNVMGIPSESAANEESVRLAAQAVEDDNSE